MEWKDYECCLQSRKITTAGGPRSQDARTNPTAPSIGLALFCKITTPDLSQPRRHHKSHEQTQSHHTGLALFRKITTTAGSEPFRHYKAHKQTQPRSTSNWLCFAKSPRRAEASQSAITRRTNKPKPPPASNWLCFAKSRQQAEPSRPAITKRTNKPNRPQHRIGSISQNHDTGSQSAKTPPQIARTNPIAPNLHTRFHVY